MIRLQEMPDRLVLNGHIAETPIFSSEYRTLWSSFQMIALKPIIQKRDQNVYHSNHSTIQNPNCKLLEYSR